MDYLNRFHSFLQPDDFPNPAQVDPTRPASIYRNQGAGFHCCPGVDFAVIVRYLHLSL